MSRDTLKNIRDVWYLMPSASPVNAAKTVPAWQSQGYRVGILQDRTRFETEADAVVTADQYPGWSASINRLFREVVPQSCRVVVAGGDDMYPDPKCTAQEIADQFMERFQGTFGVMQPMGDRFEATQTICGSPWLGRSWMERMYGGAGGLSEAYHQQWADDELYWVSKCAGRLWERPDLTQYHDHFLRNQTAAPNYWVESAASHSESDCLTFIARSRSGFPGSAPSDEEGLLDHSVFRREYAGRAEQIYRSKHGSTPNDANQRMTAALESCARNGRLRVALYGAGQHTRRVGDALRSPPVEVVAIIDDDPDRTGGLLWNFPVVTRIQALDMGVDAIILSSDSMEQTLRERTSEFSARGIEIYSLYALRGASAGVA